MKKSLIRIASIILLSSICIFYLANKSLKTRKSAYPIYRNFKKKLTINKIRKQKFNSISGINPKHFNLISFNNEEVISFDWNLNLLTKIKIPQYGKTNRYFHDDPYGNTIAFTDHSYNKIGSRHNGKIGSSIFTRIAMLDSENYVIRGFDLTRSNKDQYFITGSFKNDIKKVEKNISEENHDAGISTDGLLLYDPSVSKIIYSTFFKGEFWVFDTSLQKYSKFKTFGYEDRQNAKGGWIKKNKNSKFTHLAPPKMINYQCWVNNGTLYINSWTRDEGNWTSKRTHAYIDAYDVISGKYLFSFSIPSYDEQLPRRFGVAGNQIICIYPDYLIAYQIN